MPRFVDGPVRVSVPATSANLGPGFDALGLALTLRDELEAEVVPGGVTVEVTGEGADDVPRDESHLVVRAMRAAFAVMGEQPPGLRLSCRNVIPHSRGLGSSSAAIVAGIALARGLVAGGGLLMDDEQVLSLAADVEGHPDNVAPAFLGGFVISGREDAPVVRHPRRDRPPGLGGRVRAVGAGVHHRRPGAAARAGAARRRGGQRRSRRPAGRGAGRPPGAAAPGHPRPAPPGLPRPGHAGVAGAASTSCARRASRPSCPVPGRPCWCSPTARCSRSRTGPPGPVSCWRAAPRAGPRTTSTSTPAASSSPADPAATPPSDAGSTGMCRLPHLTGPGVTLAVRLDHSALASTVDICAMPRAMHPLPL